MSNAIVAWKVSTLGELADIAIGGTPSRDVETYWASDRTDGFPWVAISDLHDRTITNTKEQITVAGVHNSNVKLVTAGTVLMSFKLSLGRVAFAGRDLYTNEAIAAFKSRGEIAGEFLFYVLPDVVRTTATDAAIKGATLNKQSLKALRIPYPCGPVQKKIAVILTATDTAIEKTEALIAKFQQIKAGLMYDLFTRGVLPSGQLRPPRSEAPEMYQEAAIGWVPKEWEVSSLSSKGRAGVGWIRTGPFGSALKGEHWRTHGCPVITIGALGEGEFTHEELLFVGEKDAARLRDFQLKSGDVVFSRVADVGRSAVIREDQVGWIMSSNLMRIAIDENQARPDFLQMALAGDARVKAQIRANVNSGGRDVANSKVLSKLRFVWPDLAEQDRIIALSNHASQNLNMERRKAEKLKRQKIGMMQDLLTGKVAIKCETENTSMEPAA